MGPYGWWWGYVGGAPMNGISALIKGTPENSLATWGHREKTAVLEPESELSADSESARCLDACILSRFSWYDSVWPHGLQPTRLLCPWDSPSKNTGVDCHFLLQRIFLTQGQNSGLLCLLHWQAASLPLAPPGKPRCIDTESSFHFPVSRTVKYESLSFLSPPICSLVTLTQKDPKWLPYSSVGKESTCNAGDPGLILGSGRYPGEGIGYPLQYSWTSLVAQLVKNLPAMWETWFDPWVGKIPWRRERLPIPVLWPGEFHGLYNPWGHKESDMTEWLSLTHSKGLRWVHAFLLLLTWPGRKTSKMLSPKLFSCWNKGI